MHAPLDLELHEGWWPDLVARYSEPPRAYHSPRHLEEVLLRWGQVDGAELWIDRASSFAALCLHDAVYVAGAPDNEARSAALAESWCPRFCPQADPRVVAEWILLTAQHGQLKTEDLKPQAALFLDCDMAILGESARRFALYERQIRQEYRQVPELVYLSGRRHFLEGLLTQPIYHSTYFSRLLEARARTNIQQALAQ